MRDLFIWVKSLFTFENIRAVLGSLKRRIFRLSFLEMRISLSGKSFPSPVFEDVKVEGYSERLEKGCINLLNSIGSLGFWNPRKFGDEILSTVENPREDIFILSEGNLVVGLTVLHKKSLSDNSAELGYVAVKPENRGKKLGYNLLLHILARMKNRGINYGYLKTDSFRLMAIKTYLNAGFHPYIRNDNERKRWQKALDKLGMNI